ncbi:MAG: methyltransferase domain-containing protein [Candidatus Portiera sp.]|nr:methyltransferase domain-containing protein [Portiera sp.]
MDSRDFGLELAQVLGVSNYLHFGYWDPTKKATLGGLFKAQEKHTEVLLKFLNKRAAQIEAIQKKSKITKQKPLRILDIGCGSGKILGKLLECGYQVDGIIPSDHLYEATCDNVNRIKLSKNKTHAKNARESKVYKCYLDDFYAKAPKSKYDILLFCESFQYINYKLLYENINNLLKENGEIIISDYFTIPQSDGAASFSGGHRLDKFYAYTKSSQLNIANDQDISKYMAPSMDLINDILMNKLLPSSNILDEFLKSRGIFIYSALKFLGRKSLKKIEKRYFSGTITAEVFNKSKSYRMLVLKTK